MGFRMNKNHQLVCILPTALILKLGVYIRKMHTSIKARAAAAKNTMT